MTNSLKMLALTGTLFTAAQAAAIPLDNLGFENNLTGYTSQGYATTVSSVKANDRTVYAPTEGSKFLKLVSSGADTSAYGGTSGAMISTDLSLKAGDTFSFDWAFLANDYIPFNDFSLFISDGVNNLADVSTTGDRGNTGWQTYSWTPADTFNGDITFVVSNYSDYCFDSVLLLDNLSVETNAVPEPASLALLGLVLAGCLATRRRTISVS